MHAQLVHSVTNILLVAEISAPERFESLKNDIAPGQVGETPNPLLEDVGFFNADHRKLFLIRDILSSDRLEIGRWRHFFVKPV